MEGGLLKMSYKERDRLRVLSRVKEGRLSIKESAQILSLSYRHCRRIYHRYYLEGDKGLIHRSRGRPSNNQKDPDFRKRVLERYCERYPDFGPTFAAEKLEQDGYKIDHDTLRRWLMKANLWQRKRKRREHRKWRQRKAHFGEMVQMDGSHHAWFEGRGAKCCFMNMVDDATGTTFGLFGYEETTKLAMLTLRGWIERYGIPSSLYVDRRNVFVTDREPTIEETLKGELPTTHFGKVCKKLGIKIIKAYSPQAKGRVERSNGTCQDRLIKELRLAGINEIDKANEFVKNIYFDNLNKKFAISPREYANYHRSTDSETDLNAIFCLEEQRTINNDWTIRYHNRFFQIKRQSKTLPSAKKKLTVCEYLDGSIHMVYRGQEVTFEEIPRLPQKQKVNPVEWKSGNKYIPPLDHPWRKTIIGQVATL